MTTERQFKKLCNLRNVKTILDKIGWFSSISDKFSQFEFLFNEYDIFLWYIFLPEKIGNHVNIFFMKSRKHLHFYFNLILNFDAINVYLRLQMQNQMAKCVTRLQRHLWSQTVNSIYLRRLVTTSIILSCNLGNLIIFSPFFNFCNFRQFFAIFLRCENISHFLPEKIGNHVNNFFMQSRKPHHFLLYLIATVLNDSLHFFMDQFCKKIQTKL